jgi:NAD-specific glutamate dehydrogenase
MSCIFCQKEFNVKSNLVRHQISCKLNPDKPIKVTIVKKSKKEIEVEKEELKNKEQLLLQELEMMKKLLLSKNENTSENKIVSDIPFKKDRYMKYIESKYSNAFSVKDALLEIKNLLSVEEFKKVAFSQYTTKYKALLELFFAKIPKEQYPFVITKNIPSKEIGYVNIEGKFYKYYGEQLYAQLSSFITGIGIKDYHDGCKGMQNIFVKELDMILVV